MNVYDYESLFRSKQIGEEEGDGGKYECTRDAICEGSRLECGLNYDLNGVGSLCGCRVLHHHHHHNADNDNDNDDADDDDDVAEQRKRTREDLDLKLLLRRLWLFRLSFSMLFRPFLRGPTPIWTRTRSLLFMTDSTQAYIHTQIHMYIHMYINIYFLLFVA